MKLLRKLLILINLYFGNTVTGRFRKNNKKNCRESKQTQMIDLPELFDINRSALLWLFSQLLFNDRKKFSNLQEFPRTITTDLNEYTETILTTEAFFDQTTSTENYQTASTVFIPTISTRARFENFISGGNEAVPNQFPWIVRMMIAKGSGSVSQ